MRLRLETLIAGLLLCVLLIPATVKAEVYVGAKKKAEQTTNNTGIREMPVPVYNNNPEDAPIPAEDAPVISPGMNNFVNRYYENCMAQQHPILKGESLEYLCTCSAAQIASTMTETEAEAMLTDTAEGLVQRNRLLLNVYVPCMKAPVQALLYQGCMTDENVKANVKSPDALCGCMSLSMSDHIQNQAPGYILETMRQNPKTSDPMANYLSSPAYAEAAQKTLLACIDKFKQ